MIPHMARAARTAGAALVAGAAALACQRSPGRLPPELIGTWTVQDGRYSGRGFTLDSAFAVLWMGEDSATAYHIAGVTSITEAGTRIDLIALRLPDGGTDTMRVLRGEEWPDQLRLRDAPTAVFIRDSTR
jgi:hypothetical protein